MLMKVFAHGQGRGELATDYLTDETYANRDTRPPVVLRGDLELTKKIINSLETKWKYTSGVLSWHPDDKVTPQKEVELMDDFEKIAFAGLEPDRYNILWVRHTHADHHEMHFVFQELNFQQAKPLILVLQIGKRISILYANITMSKKVGLVLLIRKIKEFALQVLQILKLTN